MTVELLFGGIIEEDEASIDEDVEVRCVTLNVHQPQIIRILKLLEYIGFYNTFQTGALLRFAQRPVRPETADDYISHYCEWKLASTQKKPD